MGVTPTINELHKSDDTFTSEHSEMVNLFNDYFSSVFTSEDDFILSPETDSSSSIIDTLVITSQLVSSKLITFSGTVSPLAPMVGQMSLVQLD